MSKSLHVSITSSQSPSFQIWTYPLANHWP
jgi:hypothetical protein